MKKYILLLLTISGFAQSPFPNGVQTKGIFSYPSVGGIGINTNSPDPSAILDIISTTKGLRIPNVTTTQQNAIVSPATSLLVFNTTEGRFKYYDGSIWVPFGVPTNLSYTASPTNGQLTNSNGTGAYIPLADSTNAGLLSPNGFISVSNLSGTNTGDEILGSGESYLSKTGHVWTANPVNLSGTNVTGTLPISRGGTNQTSNGTNGQVLTSNGSGGTSWTTPSSGGITSLSIATANGLNGTSSGGNTPTLTLGTPLSASVVKASGTGFVAATAGTDYQAPITVTATGTSGAASQPNANTINVPRYDNYADTQDALKANIASPALTGMPTAPTASSGNYSTQISNDAFVQQEVSKYSPLTGISQYYGKKAVIFGDSYSAGTGATAATRFTTMLCQMLGMTETNFGVAGSTLQKRAPINYNGATNMVDRVTNIPVYDATYGLLIFEFGLNDMGYVGGSYSTVNYKIDYQTVLNYAISTQGWPRSKIVLLTPFWINSTGYSQYSTSPTTPTPANNLAYVQATKEVALDNQIKCIDMYVAVQDNDQSLLVADGLHPNVLGHLFIARAVANVLDYSRVLNNQTFASSATPPIMLNYGATVSSANADPTKMIFRIYDDGTARAGLSSTASRFEIFGSSSQDIYMYKGTTIVGSGNNTLFTFTGRVGGATPTATTDLTTKGYVDGLQPYTATATLDFPSTLGQAQQGLTVTVTGAAVGKPVRLGYGTSAVTAGIIFTAYVSAANTVTVMASNITSSAKDPASDSFTVTVDR